MPEHRNLPFDVSLLHHYLSGVQEGQTFIIETPDGSITVDQEYLIGQFQILHSHGFDWQGNPIPLKESESGSAINEAERIFAATRARNGHLPPDGSA